MISVCVMIICVPRVLTHVLSLYVRMQQRYEKVVQEEKDAMQLLYFVQERLADLHEKISHSVAQIAALEVR